MRLLTRRIHRAFPQLDPYPDDVCWKFIDAARGSRGIRTLSRLSVALVGLILTPVGCLLWAWMFAAMIGTDAITLRQSGWKLALWALAIPFTLGLGPVAAYFWRDRLLGWRLRYVLGTSGRCPACRYSLIGLALTDQSTVFCPECGAECEVDPSLGELARGTTGRVRTRPAGEHAAPADLVFKRPPLLSPGKRRLLKRAAIAAALLVFVVLPGSVGLWELMIRRDAALARADLARLEAEFRDLLVKSGLAPTGSAAAGGGLSTHLAFDRAVDALQEAQRRWEQAHASPDEPRPAPGFDSLAAEDFAAWASNMPSPEVAQRERDGARELMQLCREARLPELLAAIAASTPELPEPERTLSLRMQGTLHLTPQGQAAPWLLDGYLEAWAQECRRAPTLDAAELLRLIDTRLGLARVMAASPLFADKSWAIRNELRGHELLLELLATHPDQATLNAARASLDRHAYDLRLKDLVDWSRLQTAEAIAQFFADPDAVRLGPFSRFARETRSASLAERRLGWYAENRDLVTARCSLPGALFEQDAVTRPFTAPMPAPLPLPAARWIQDPAPFLGMLDVHTARRRGLRTLLALEQHRARTGAYPAQLADLVPGALPALPNDPWTGRPFVYAPRAAGAAWPFVLYALGPDAVDDNGAAPGRAQRAGLYGFRSAPGTDEVINVERAPTP